MDEAVLRQLMVGSVQQMWMRGLIVADEGVVSAEIHRRRYLVTPPRKRRSDLREADMLVIDLGGMALPTGNAVGSAAGLDAGQWRAHRVAYQARGEQIERKSMPAPGDVSMTTIKATIVSQPPMLMALARKKGMVTNRLELMGLPPLPIVVAEDDASLRAAVLGFNAVVLRSVGLLTMAGDLITALNMTEKIEHAARIELAVG